MKQGPDISYEVEPFETKMGLFRNTRGRNDVQLLIQCNILYKDALKMHRCAVARV